MAGEHPQISLIGRESVLGAILDDPKMIQEEAG
jgi:hypothetical protein